MKKEFGLRPPEDFYYLAQSGCLEVDRRSEKDEFNELLKAFDSLNIDAASQKQILQCLAGILHLGNLNFVPSTAKDVENGSQVANAQECKRVATLLGTNAEVLERALCYRDSVFNGETILIPLDPGKAIDQRDALAKYIYGKTFDTVVHRVNNALFRGKVGNNIGVLDIFGFEVFKTNSFEQLCINYCNERLQTFFNEIIFEGELKMYRAEGIDCDDITFQDNMACVRLIDLKGAGIFAMIDEEIVVPKGTDEKLILKMHTVFDETAVTKSPYYARNRKAPKEFIVRHFAGEVSYEITNFMEKNKDALAPTLLQAMLTSSLSLLSTEIDSKANAAGAASGGGGGSGGAKKPGAKLTLAAKFKLDLDVLMASLRTTSPHFIRCIKPNELQQPERFDPLLTLNQLKYSGLFEAIRIRKSGYAVRLPHAQFIQRYRCCSLSKGAKLKGPPLSEQDVATQLVEKLSVLIKFANTPGKIKNYSIGISRVFLRTMAMRHALEALRDANAGNSAIPIQRVIRGFLARRRFDALSGNAKQEKQAARKREAMEVSQMANCDVESRELELDYRRNIVKEMAIKAERQAKMRAELARLLKIKNDAASAIQKMVRGIFGRKRGRCQMCEKMFEKALISRDEELLKRALVMPSFFGVTSRAIKSYQSEGKALVMDVLSESYVRNQLVDAINSGSGTLMKDAIQLAESHRMTFLPQLRGCKEALEGHERLHSTLSFLTNELSRSVTVCKLLSKVDLIRKCVQQATAMGLGGEEAVLEAVLRLGKIRNLIAMRDKIRFAVEICSPTQMDAAMTERAKFIPLFGIELCAEEIAAVDGMRKMLAYQKQVKEKNRALAHDNNNDASSRGAGDDTEMPEAAPNTYERDKGDRKSSVANIHDVHLPPWAASLLEAIRDARTPSGKKY